MAARFALSAASDARDSNYAGDGPAAASDWSQHEHVADAVTKEAQRLVNLAGSIELAKQAVESAAQPAPIAIKEAFAEELGYHGIDELRAATIVLESHDGADWNITCDQHGQWVAWNEQNVEVCDRFESRDEAVATLRGTTDGWRL